jgi:hypothetical protein
MAPLAITGASAFVFPMRVSAQSSVGLACGTNHCESSIIGTGIAAQFKYTWSFTGAAHFVPSPGGSPIDTCNRLNASACRFTCYQGYRDNIAVHVNAVDGNGSFLGDASANAICDGSAP